MFKKLESLINKTILLDPRTRERLNKLQSKRLRIQISDLPPTFFLELFFDNQGLHVSRAKNESADTIIQGSILSFLTLIISKDAQKAAKLGLTIEGDIETGQNVQNLISDLEIDWEEPLSYITNDAIANRLGVFFRIFRKRQRELLASLQRNTTDYLQEETRILTSKEEVDLFFEDIDTLRNDVARMEARLIHFEQLQGKMKSSNLAMGAREDRGNMGFEDKARGIWNE